MGCFDLRIFSDALWIQKNSQWIKKTILSALLQFFKTKKVLLLEKMFYFLLRNNRSIRDDAQYSKPCKKSIWQEVKITGQPGSKHDIQMEKWNNQRKAFYVQKLKEKNKFLVYLAVLHLNSVGIFGCLYKTGTSGTSYGEKWLLNGSLHTQLESTTIYYTNWYIWKKAAL